MVAADAHGQAGAQGVQADQVALGAQLAGDAAGDALAAGGGCAVGRRGAVQAGLILGTVQAVVVDALVPQIDVGQLLRLGRQHGGDGVVLVRVVRRLCRVLILRVHAATPLIHRTRPLDPAQAHSGPKGGPGIRPDANLNTHRRFYNRTMTIFRDRNT
jgi:hypothetical protein